MSNEEKKVLLKLVKDLYAEYKNEYTMEGSGTGVNDYSRKRILKLKNKFDLMNEQLPEEYRIVPEFVPQYSL